MSILSTLFRSRHCYVDHTRIERTMIEKDIERSLARIAPLEAEANVREIREREDEERREVRG